MQSFVKMVSYLSLRPMVYLYSHEGTILLANPPTSTSEADW